MREEEYVRGGSKEGPQGSEWGRVRERESAKEGE